jgi:hypothetical protein
MKNGKFLFISFLLLVFSINIVTAFIFGPGSPPPTSGGLVNFTYMGNLTSGYIPQAQNSSYFNNSIIRQSNGNLYISGNVNNSGYSLVSSYLLGLIGSIDIRGSPWYLSGVDLEIAQNLKVNGDFQTNNLLIDGNISSTTNTTRGIKTCGNGVIIIGDLNLSGVYC